MHDFSKVVRLGTAKTYLGERSYSIYCKIEYKKGRLSITGVEGPLANGNAIGSCGQIDMHLKPEDITPAPGWTRERIRAFLALWQRWHLNDMKAGTPAQEAHLRTLTFPGYHTSHSHYEWAKAELAKVGLQPDDGYSYGSEWKIEQVPDEVLAELQALPDTDEQPAWV